MSHRYQLVTAEATTARIRATAADKETGMVCILVKYEQVIHNADGTVSLIYDPNNPQIELLTKMVPGLPNSEGESTPARAASGFMEKALEALKEHL